MAFFGTARVSDTFEGLVHESNSQSHVADLLVLGLHILADLGLKFRHGLAQSFKTLSLLAVPISHLTVAILVDGHVSAILLLDRLLGLVAGAVLFDRLQLVVVLGVLGEMVHRHFTGYSPIVGVLHLDLETFSKLLRIKVLGRFFVREPSGQFISL